jgi:hypothetical protein
MNGGYLSLKTGNRMQVPYLIDGVLFVPSCRTNWIVIYNFADVLVDRLALQGLTKGQIRGQLAGLLVCMGLMDNREDAHTYVYEVI